MLFEIGVLAVDLGPHRVELVLTRGWAKKTLNQWCQLAAEIDHPQVRRFIGRLRFFEYGILNHCNYAISTGRLEGVNNKIKVIKRKDYGFHDPAYFALKVK